MQSTILGRTKKVKVIGIGGAAGCMFDAFVDAGFDQAELIIADTEYRSLERVQVQSKIELGGKGSRHHGVCGFGNPELGRANTLPCRDEIATRLSDSELVVIVAGMGGGTGTGGAPVFAQIGRETGASVVSVVTRPFTWEGKRRRRRAEDGIDALKPCVDALVVLNNDDHPVSTVVGQTLGMYEWRGVTMATLRAVREILEIHAAHLTDRQQFSVLVSQMTASK